MGVVLENNYRVNVNAFNCFENNVRRELEGEGSVYDEGGTCLVLTNNIHKKLTNVVIEGCYSGYTVAGLRIIDSEEQID